MAVTSHILGLPGKEAKASLLENWFGEMSLRALTSTGLRESGNHLEHLSERLTEPDTYSGT